MLLWKCRSFWDRKCLDLRWYICFQYMYYYRRIRRKSGVGRPINLYVWITCYGYLKHTSTSFCLISCKMNHHVSKIFVCVKIYYIICREKEINENEPKRRWLYDNADISIIHVFIKSPTRLNMERANFQTTLANDFRNLVLNTVYYLTFEIFGIDGLVLCNSITHISDWSLPSRLCMQYFVRDLISSSSTIYRTGWLRTA